MTQPAKSENPPSLVEILLVCGFVILAWWPLLLQRPLAADDYFVATLFEHGLGDYWDFYGIWRIAGHALPILLGNRVVPFLALATHAGTALLLLAILRRLVASRPIILATACAFAALPFGFQALTWNAAYSFALSTGFCLAALLTVLRPIEDLRTGLATGFGAALLTFASLCSNEATLLLFGWVAILPIMLQHGRPGARARWVTAAGLLAAGTAWVALHLATKAATFHKHLSLHPQAFLSGLFRQVGQITFFVNLPHLFPWLPAAAWLSAALAFVLTLAAIKRAQSAGKATSSLPGPITRSSSSLHPRLLFAVLPIAAVSIYALGDGFSTDSRKAYVFWPFLLLTAAYFLQGTSAKIQHLAAIGVLLGCPILVLSAQASERAWADTATMFNAVYMRIWKEALEEPLRFDWQPNIYTAWPDFDRLCGFRFDSPWVLDNVADPRKVRADGYHLTLHWNPGTHQWENGPREP